MGDNNSRLTIYGCNVYTLLLCGSDVIIKLRKWLTPGINNIDRPTIYGGVTLLLCNWISPKYCKT